MDYGNDQERVEIEEWRERTKGSLARAIQKWALGSDHAGVGDHYTEAAEQALRVLAPASADEVIQWRRDAGISPIVRGLDPAS
jgi:hypothetical protein